MVELVVFSHLHGYLLFLVFLLGSLVLVLHAAAAPPGRGGAAIWGAWALACLSAFTYEMGQCYGVLAGLFLAATHYRRIGAWRTLALFAAFAGILPLYQAVNHLDRFVHRGEFPDEKTGQALVARAFTSDTLKNAGRFTVYTAFQPFVPSAEKDAYVIDRLNVPEWAWNGDGPRLGSALLASLALLPAVALGLAGVWRMARQGRTVLLGIFLLLLPVRRLRRDERLGADEPPPRAGRPQQEFLLRLPGAAAGTGGRLHRLARTGTGEPRRRGLPGDSAPRPGRPECCQRLRGAAGQ